MPVSSICAVSSELTNTGSAQSSCFQATLEPAASHFLDLPHLPFALAKIRAGKGGERMSNGSIGTPELNESRGFTSLATPPLLSFAAEGKRDGKSEEQQAPEMLESSNCGQSLHQLVVSSQSSQHVWSSQQKWVSSDNLLPI